MTPLRAEMIKAMQMHGFSPRTHQSYLAAVTDLARYHHRSPDTLAIADLNGYFEYLRGWSACADRRSRSGRCHAR